MVSRLTVVGLALLCAVATRAQDYQDDLSTVAPDANEYASEVLGQW
ncbi:hypothetical protein [Bradyrhizobium icense]|nr:hypothetical protein [Bradyrhizobium icense]